VGRQLAWESGWKDSNGLPIGEVNWKRAPLRGSEARENHNLKTKPRRRKNFLQAVVSDKPAERNADKGQLNHLSILGEGKRGLEVNETKH